MAKRVFGSLFRGSIRSGFTAQMSTYTRRGRVSLVISPDGRAKFDIDQLPPPQESRYIPNKEHKMNLRSKKEARKNADKSRPKWLTVTQPKNKPKFDSPIDKLNYNIQMARLKESKLVERLKQYQVPKMQGPILEPHNLTAEERFFLRKTGMKRTNYAPLGRRGIFGGVILNMHMHWKRHETVKVTLNQPKPGQIEEFAQEIARLSGGTPIHIVNGDTIVFYRGRNYVRPDCMSPIDTLSKRKAYEKSRYEDSLNSVRQYIDVTLREIELYRKHTALYGDPIPRNSASTRSIKSHRPPKHTVSYKGPIDYDTYHLGIHLTNTDSDVIPTDSEPDYH